MSNITTAVGTPDVSANASSKSLVRNATVSYLANIVGMLTGFFVTPILIRHLGATNFGIWVLLGSLIGYLGLIEVGTSTATAKRVAECRANGDTKRLREVLGTAAALYLAVSLIVLVVTVVLLFNLQHFFHFPVNRLPLARICLFVLGINQAVSFLFLVQTTVLFGAGRLDLMTRFGTVIGTLSSITQAFLAWYGYGIVAMAATLVIATATSGYIGRRVISKHIPGVEIKLAAATTTMARELLKFGSRNSIVAICGTIAFSADALIIGLLLPVANVAHYAVAARLVTLIRTLSSKPMDILLPAYAHSHALGDSDRQFRLLSESLSLSLALALPFAIVFCAFGEHLIRAWVGTGQEVSYPILITLALALPIQLQGHACFTIMTATERNQVLIRTVVISAPVNFTLSFLFTKAFGPIGPALGTLVTVAIADAVVLPIAACREFGFSYRRYLSHSITPLFLPAGVTILFAMAMRFFLREGTVVGLIAKCGLTACIFLVIWLYYGINAERRYAYFQRIRATISTTP
jgi:O-antigen/teichoic acid export membrane protein